MNLSVREITTQEFATLEQEIRASHVDISSMVETWKSLDAYFSKQLIFNDEKFRWTYFRIYTELSWKMFGSQSRDFIVDVAIKRQLPMAVQLDFDPFEQIINYLGLRTLDRADTEGLYLKMQKAFLESEAIVGVWQGKNITVAEIIKEATEVNSAGDSLAQADFESRVRQIMFADETAKKYSTAEPEDAKERFLDIISFFQTFTQDNIWFVVDSFVNPQKYQNAATGEAATAPVSATETSSKFKVPETVRPSRPPASVPKPVAPVQPAPIAKPPVTTTPKPPAPVQSVPKPAAPALPTPQEIKKEIEAQFKKDAEGNFEDMDTVLAMLSTLSEKYNNPKIADMLYFDETENKFVWNI